MISTKLISALVLATILSTSSSVAATSVTTSSNSNYYTVQKGESLWTISQKFNTTADTLVKINNLKNSSYIEVGQTLLIKEAPIVTQKESVTTNYIVKPGDSLWTIAKTFNTSADALVKINNLKNSSYIEVGQTLLTKEAPIVTQKDTVTTNYIVKPGDSLWTIAKTFNTTADTLVKINNLKNSSYIKVGQTLLINEKPTVTLETPIIKTEISTVNYVAKLGDSLWSLAKKYNTSVDAIMKSNMLTADYLMPNQTITIPIGTTEVVKPVGITMMNKRINNNYGDLYNWENAMRIFTVNTTGSLKDLQTGITFNIKYYGGSNHADLIPLTKDDTAKFNKIFPNYSWNAMRPMVLYFNKGGINYQMAVSVSGMPHSTTNIYNNGMDGHFDTYFYNSTSHNTNKMSPTHQANVLKANGQ